MNIALMVLAECVDARTGKRFMPGQEFQPVPTLAQANRLIAAGCLPAGARDEAEKADVLDQAEIEAEVARKAKAEAAALALITARNVKSAADLALEDAKAKLAQAVTPDETTAAKKEHAAAEKAAKLASEELAKLTK